MKTPATCFRPLDATLLAAYQATTAILTTALLFAIGAPSARAVTAIQHIYWDPGHSGATPGSGGDGLWDATTPNWIISSNIGDQAYSGNNNGGVIFAGTAGTVSLNASGLVAAAVEFDTAGYTLQDAPGTGYALTIPTANIALSAQIASGTVTVSLPINLTSTTGTDLNARTGGTLVITGTLTASSGFNVGNNPNAGMVILSGNNAVGGIVRVDEGTLQLAGTGTNQPLGGASSLQVANHGTLLYGASNQVPVGVPVTMFNNGTINVNGQSQDQAHALGALTLSSAYSGDSSTIDFSSNLSLKSVVAFGNSSATAWSGTLNVYNYHGTPGIGSGTDQLFFGTDTTGLTTSQLSEIAFYAGGAGSAELGTGIILSDGEVTYGAVPEPATWVGALLLGGTGLILRRRSRTA